MSERKKTTKVQMYFTDEVMEVYNDLQEVAKVTGFSMSELAYIGFVTGFYEVKDALLKYQRLPNVKKPRRKAKAKAK